MTHNWDTNALTLQALDAETGLPIGTLQEGWQQIEKDVMLVAKIEERYVLMVWLEELDIDKVKIELARFLHLCEVSEEKQAAKITLYFGDGSPLDPVRALREAIDGAHWARKQFECARDSFYYNFAYRYLRSTVQRRATPFSVGYVHAWEQMERARKATKGEQP